MDVRLDAPTAPGSYTIRSRAVDDSGNLETPAAGVTVTVRDSVPPAGPTGLTATVAAVGNNLTWNANTETDLAGYNVYRSGAPAGTFTKLNPALLTGSAFADTGAPSGAVSYYRVTAVDTSSNESAPATASAGVDVTAPSAPGGLAAAATNTGIVLSWTANPEVDVAGYQVYRSATEGGTYVRVTGAAVTSPTFEDTLAPAGASYYQVTAVDFSGNESSRSPFATASMAKANRIANPGFEIDANNDLAPDSWSTNSAFRRTNAAARSDSFSGRHSSTTNAGYTITGLVTGLAAGSTYDVAGWVYVPPTTDNFTFRVQVRWRRSTNQNISTTTIATISAPTGGWTKVSAQLVAPSGTTNAQVLMVLTSLRATVYVDDFAMR